MKNSTAGMVSIVVLLLLVLGGTYLYYGANKYQTVLPPATTSTNEQSEGKASGLTLAEVTQHSTADNCWFAIEGKVYDVTKFIEGAKHPGGAAILQGCGKDATELFNTRPMGSKTPHSDKARSFLPQFYIGDLK